jgi:hypothetical protein
VGTADFGRVVRESIGEKAGDLVGPPQYSVVENQSGHALGRACSERDR